MNCYKFEENISAFIDGELTQSLRIEFTHHKEQCEKCNGQLNDLLSLLVDLKGLGKITTSEDFVSSLQGRIEDYNNTKENYFQRLSKVRPFGFRPAAAIGVAAAICLLTISSFLLFQEEAIPEFDTTKYSQNGSVLQNSSSGELSEPIGNPIASRHDSINGLTDSLDIIRKRYDDQIQTVGHKKTK